MEEIVNNLIDKINKASTIIHNASLRGSGNFIIVNSQVAETINNMDKIRLRRKKIEKIMRRMK